MVLVKKQPRSTIPARIEPIPKNKSPTLNQFNSSLPIEYAAIAPINIIYFKLKIKLNIYIYNITYRLLYTINFVLR